MNAGRETAIESEIEGTGTRTRTGTEIAIEIVRGIAIGTEIEETGTETGRGKAGGKETRLERERTGTRKSERRRLLPVVRDGMIVGPARLHTGTAMEAPSRVDAAEALRRGR